MTDKVGVNNGGAGFLGLLCLLFIGLKLTGYITWSWWWVTAPLWGGFLAALFLFLLAFIVLWAKEVF